MSGKSDEWSGTWGKLFDDMRRRKTCDEPTIAKLEDLKKQLVRHKSRRMSTKWATLNAFLQLEQALNRAIDQAKRGQDVLYPSESMWKEGLK